MRGCWEQNYKTSSLNHVVLGFDFLDFTGSNNKLIMIKLIRKTLKSQPRKSLINNQQGLLGLRVDMYGESLFLPSQTQLLKKQQNKQTKKTNQTRGIRYVLLVIKKSHFILNHVVFLTPKNWLWVVLKQLLLLFLFCSKVWIWTLTS